MQLLRNKDFLRAVVVSGLVALLFFVYLAVFGYPRTQERNDVIGMQVVEQNY